MKIRANMLKREQLLLLVLCFSLFSILLAFNIQFLFIFIVVVVTVVRIETWLIQCQRRLVGRCKIAETKCFGLLLALMTPLLLSFQCDLFLDQVVLRQELVMAIRYALELVNQRHGTFHHWLLASIVLQGLSNHLLISRMQKALRIRVIIVLKWALRSVMV